MFQQKFGFLQSELTFTIFLENALNQSNKTKHLYFTIYKNEKELYTKHQQKSR